MNNSYYNVSHSRDYYKGKSVEFAGEWTSGVRYFNDEYLNSLVVYTEKDATGNIIHSALLACKKTHIAAYNSSIPDSTNNQPHLVIDNNLGVIGIEPNDYWIFVSGSLVGTPGKSAEIVNTYLEALTFASESNIGKIVFVKEEKSAYLIIGAGELKKIVSTSELLELAENKVDKELGKGLSTNDYSNTEKAKLKGIEENAQKNVIEEIDLNGVKVKPVNKVVSINVDAEVTENSNNLVTSGAVYEKLESKQDQLIPGNNITIQNNVISTTGKVDLPEYAKTEDVDKKLGTKQDTLIPGNGINIEDNQIDVTVITESETQPDTPIWVNPLEDTEVGLTYNRSQINALVGSKQDIISDLETIREGAIKGETALQPMQNITYAELVALRDSASLVAGMKYRITNYACTTTQENTQSAGHPFDIIVTADSKNTLNEVARAIQHEGDTYFADCDLSAWKIWYCLDNDNTRFVWADSANGKGVIYRMIDEWNNDVPYDFKNIQFARDLAVISNNSALTGTIYCYTFSMFPNGFSQDSTASDESVIIKQLIASVGFIFFGNNKIASYSMGLCALNDIIFFSEGTNLFHYANTFGANCYSNTFEANCYSNIFGANCYANTFGDNCRSNSFGNDCFGNTFGNNCFANTFGNNCRYNSFGNDCNYINFASSSSATTKYDYYSHNHFGDGCQYILLKGEGTASSSTQVQNYKFAQGLHGTQNKYFTIDGVRSRAYETKVAKNSNGELKIYCEADLIQ